MTVCQVDPTAAPADTVTTAGPTGGGSVPGLGSSLAPSVRDIEGVVRGLDPLKEPTCDSHETPPWAERPSNDPTTFAGCYPTKIPEWQDEPTPDRSQVLQLVVEVVDFDA